MSYLINVEGHPSPPRFNFTKNVSGKKFRDGQYTYTDTYGVIPLSLLHKYNNASRCIQNRFFFKLFTKNIGNQFSSASRCCLVVALSDLRSYHLFPRFMFFSRA